MHTRAHMKGYISERCPESDQCFLILKWRGRHEENILHLHVTRYFPWTYTHFPLRVANICIPPPYRSAAGSNTHSDFLQLSPQPPCVFLLEIPSVSWNKEPFGVRSRLRVGWSEISWTKLSKSRFVLPFPDFSYVVSQRPTSAPRWRLRWHRAARLGPFGRRKAGWGLWWH